MICPTFSKLPPLAVLTSREGSFCMVQFTISFVLNCPHASLKGTQTTIHGKLYRASIILFHSLRYIFSDSELRSLSVARPYTPGWLPHPLPISPLGMSC